jgi:hypothetical protein
MQQLQLVSFALAMAALVVCGWVFTRKPRKKATNGDIAAFGEWSDAGGYAGIFSLGAKYTSLGPVDGASIFADAKLLPRFTFIGIFVSVRYLITASGNGTFPEKTGRNFRTVTVTSFENSGSTGVSRQ